MDQYLWFKSKLEEAIRLRDSEHRVDWILVTVHKPLYTLKGGHRPEGKTRDIYQPLFDSGQVDFVIHGHSHNMQRALPIEYWDLDQEPIITA
jgi:Calcineurin-like phosphoesterase